MSKLPSLIAIENDIKEIMLSIQNQDGEITEAQELELTKKLIESKDKVSSYCFVLDNMQNEIDYVESKIKEAKEYIDRIDKQKERLLKIALDVINAKGEKLEGSSGHWIGKRKSTSVSIKDENQIDPFYIKLIQSIDKAAIKKDLQDGKEVSGAELITKENVTWK